MKIRPVSLFVLCSTVLACAGPAASDQQDGLKIIEATLKPFVVGTHAVVTVWIQNDAAQALQNPSVQCNFVDAAGATLSSSTQVLHGNFPARQTTTLTGIDFGAIDQKTTAVRCQIVAG